MVLVTIMQSDGNSVELQCNGMERDPFLPDRIVLLDMVDHVGTSKGDMKVDSWSVPISSVSSYIRGTLVVDLVDGKAMSATEKQLYLQRKREEAAREELLKAGSKEDATVLTLVPAPQATRSKKTKPALNGVAHSTDPTAS